jgi:uncharacterized protein (TIGR02246 family)
MILPRDPEDIPAAIAEAWNARNASAFAALFAEDADVVNVVGLWWRKRAEIERAHAYGFAKIFRNASMKVARTRIAVWAKAWRSS